MDCVACCHNHTRYDHHNRIGVPVPNGNRNSSHKDGCNITAGQFTDVESRHSLRCELGAGTGGIRNQIDHGQVGGPGYVIGTSGNTIEKGDQRCAYDPGRDGYITQGIGNCCYQWHIDEPRAKSPPFSWLYHGDQCTCDGGNHKIKYTGDHHDDTHQAQRQ